MANPQTQTETRTKTKAELKYPDRFHVILHNDDFTPMDFVISLLVEVFNKDLNAAKDLTMSVHHEGSAVAGTYFKEVAEQKVVESNTLARLNGYPLKTTMEMVE